MNINKICEHIVTLKSALADLYILADAEAILMQYGSDKNIQNKSDLLLTNYSEKILSLMPDLNEDKARELLASIVFPESNAIDISETPQGQNAITMMHNLVNEFGKNVKTTN